MSQIRCSCGSNSATAVQQEFELGKNRKKNQRKKAKAKEAKSQESSAESDSKSDTAATAALAGAWLNDPDSVRALYARQLIAWQCCCRTWK